MLDPFRVCVDVHNVFHRRFLFGSCCWIQFENEICFPSTLISHKKMNSKPSKRCTEKSFSWRLFFPLSPVSGLLRVYFETELIYIQSGCRCRLVFSHRFFVLLPFDTPLSSCFLLDNCFLFFLFFLLKKQNDSLRMDSDTRNSLKLLTTCVFMYPIRRLTRKSRKLRTNQLKNL